MVTTFLISSLLTVKGTQGSAQRYACLVDTPIQSKENHTTAELSFTVNLSTWVMVTEDPYTLSRLSEEPAYSTLLSYGSTFLPFSGKLFGEDSHMFVPNSCPASSLSSLLTFGLQNEPCPHGWLWIGCWEQDHAPLRLPWELQRAGRKREHDPDPLQNAGPALGCHRSHHRHHQLVSKGRQKGWEHLVLL